MRNNKTIFITGGNRGIGKGLVAQLCYKHNVIFSVRSNQKGQETLDDLSGCKAKFVVMNVDDPNSVQEGVNKLRTLVNSIDILFNNAGILISGIQNDNNALDTDEESIMKTFNTNTLGVLRVTRHIVPLMGNGGRIINISSGMGQLDEMESGSTAYRLSKTALNALSKILSNDMSSKVTVPVSLKIRSEKMTISPKSFPLS